MLLIMDEKCDITKLPHHIQQKLCYTRPPYRQGKRFTSVKVYTINDESKHLMICGVPQLQLGEEVKKLIEPYGNIKRIHVVPDYHTEEFTDAYYVQYVRIQSARIAKRFIDGKNFYGGLLHVFYLPELETISETRAKLLQRRRDIAIRIKRNQQDMQNPNANKFVPKEQYHRRKKTPALPLTEERLSRHYPGETLSSIYDGIPSNLDPRPISEPSLPSTSYNYQQDKVVASTLVQTPYQPSEAIIKAGETEGSIEKDNKKKNFKGQYVNNNVKVKVVIPQLVDTSTIVKWDNPNKNVFSNPKKAQTNITIKLIPKNDGQKKRILMRDSSITQLVQPSEDLQLSIKEAKSQIRAAIELNNKGK